MSLRPYRCLGYLRTCPCRNSGRRYTPLLHFTQIQRTARRWPTPWGSTVCMVISSNSAGIGTRKLINFWSRLPSPVIEATIFPNDHPAKRGSGRFSGVRVKLRQCEFETGIKRLVSLIPYILTHTLTQGKTSHNSTYHR